jgi:hypothetical protein
MILMTAAAPDGIYSLSVATANIHCVAMAVVTLAGKVSTGMTIHTARVAKHGNNCFESRSGADIVWQHNFTGDLRVGMFHSLIGNP